MSPFLEHSEFYNQPIRLSEDQKADPHSVLESFFCDYHLSELRDFLSEVSETCLTTEEPPFSEAQRRADLLVYHSKIEELLEAAYLIAQQRRATENE